MSANEAHRLVSDALTELVEVCVMIIIILCFLYNNNNNNNQICKAPECQKTSVALRRSLMHSFHSFRSTWSEFVRLSCDGAQFWARSHFSFIDCVFYNVLCSWRLRQKTTSTMYYLLYALPIFTK